MTEHDGQRDGRASGRDRHVIDATDLHALVADHARLHGLCDRLEACADLLPDTLSQDDAGALGRSLQAIIAGHLDQENAVIDALFARDGVDALTAALLGRIRARHLSDAIDADDIVAVLSGASRPGAEAFGFMLRGFFEGCRAAMAFTELVVLLLGAPRLSHTARAMLIDSLCARRAG